MNIHVCCSILVFSYAHPPCLTFLVFLFSCIFLMLGLLPCAIPYLRDKNRIFIHPSPPVSPRSLLAPLLAYTCFAYLMPILPFLSSTCTYFTSLFKQYAYCPELLFGAPNCALTRAIFIDLRIYSVQCLCLYSLSIFFFLFLFFFFFFFFCFIFSSFFSSSRCWHPLIF